jgi:hypothetical protein
MNLTFVVDKIKYHWVGCYGCLFYSYEYSRKKGDVCLIDGRLMYVYQVHKDSLPFLKPRVDWCIVPVNPSDDITMVDIRKIKSEIFSCK